jgi:hypothetical protein
MAEEYLKELKVILDTEKRVKEEITKLIDWQSKTKSFENSLSNEIEIEKLFDDISISIEKSERINRTSLNRISVPEISKRSKIIEEIKTNTRNLNRYYYSTVKSGKENLEIRNKINHNPNGLDNKNYQEMSYSELVENKRKGS